MDRSEKSSTSTTMSSLTQSDKYALAFQLVTQLTSLVDGVLFAKRMAVLQVIKEAWEKNTEVTVITEESSFDCGEQMNPDTAERMQSPQMAPVDSNLGSIEENPATFQALDVVVKQEVEHPGMPRIEQVVGYGLHPMGVAGYTDRALSSVDESGSSVTGSPEAENTRDLDQSPNTRPDFDQTSGHSLYACSPPRPGLVHRNIASMHKMTELSPGIPIYVYSSNITSAMRHSSRSATKMACTLLNAFYTNEELSTLGTLRNVPKEIVDAVVDFTLQNNADTTATPVAIKQALRTKVSGLKWRSTKSQAPQQNPV
ncbi:uncharacterized protein LOC119733400 isoform X2 [Patiria miniata]|uniref:BEN domain-containing protein n=1 Tax=Patiria miniata TaxID=46514 RepID=A0A914AHA5_PATMI|nr:uncharacterized protein LOC119733400 isoform X2 [Patiria miniata]